MPPLAPVMMPAEEGSKAAEAEAKAVADKTSSGSGTVLVTQEGRIRDSRDGRRR